MNNLREQLINFDWSLKSVIKAALALVVVVIALAIVLSVVTSVAKNVFGYGGGYGYDDYDRNEASFVEEFVGGIGGSLGFDGAYNSKTTLSSRGMVASQDMAIEPGFLPPVPYGEGGADAEDYERRNYNAHYETRKFEETCTAISDLKPLEYVVFDNSNKSEDWCSYTFRVEVENEDEIIAKLKTLDPREFDINTNTIERSIEYSDSELAMQQRRLESTQETLAQAESSFNSLIARATQEGDTATLSEVINNKISTIERLNQQILNTQERIDRLSKGRGEQVEQIEYAHFNVSISKVTFFDGQQFADEWKQRIQELFYEINATLLALTVGLVAFVLGAIKFVVFGAITVLGLVVFAKIIWVIVKRIWKWEKKSYPTDNI